MKIELEISPRNWTRKTRQYITDRIPKLRVPIRQRLNAKYCRAMVSITKK